MESENVGFNSILDKKFRDKDYHDSITMNSDYQYPEELPFYLIHEIGHSFEEQLRDIIISGNIEALPVGIDENYADFYADLIACYILRPELLKSIETLDITNNTVLAIRQMFGDNDFLQLREELEGISGSLKLETKNSKDQSTTSGGQTDRTFGRVFRKIKEYLNT